MKEANVMAYEVSCGAVIFTRAEGEIRYLVIRQRAGFHGFPKGHMERGENEIQTALREISEEVGLAPRLIPGFRTVEEHPLPQKPGVTKRVIYFLAEYEGQEVTIQESELCEAVLVSYEQAMSMLEYDNARRVLTEAHDFLHP